MSHQAQTWVIRHSRHKGANLLLLYLIANHAHPDGTHADAGEKTLAQESRMSERQVRRIVKEKLVPSGELVVNADAGPRGANRYVLPGIAIDGPVPLPEPDKMSAPLKEKMAAPDEDKTAGSGKIPDKMSAPLKDISAPSCGHPPGARALCASAEPINPRELREKQGIQRESETPDAHAPPRARASPLLIEIPIPFPFEGEDLEWATAQGMSRQWLETHIARYVDNFEGTGTMRSLTTWRGKCRKWLSEDLEREKTGRTMRR